jgi:lipopolysaccharide biosynthesis protein
MNSRARVFAYYLPQFHPTPENDLWWGKGFTEWTNVTKAQPLFSGHWQPHFPADLGYYDLRVPEVRHAQAEMAREHGIEGFCYYHYWFGDGRQLLERPFNEVLSSGEPDFPFALCWANHTWSGIWYGAPDKVLMEQRYPGRHDCEDHFNFLLRAFSDERYIKVDGKPVFQILIPSDLPSARQTTDTFRELAQKHGLPGIYLIAGYYYESMRNLAEDGFDASVSRSVLDVFSRVRRKPQLLFSKFLANRFLNKGYLKRILAKRFLQICDYRDMVELLLQNQEAYPVFPCVLSNWDNTPRSGIRGVIVKGSNPQLFAKLMYHAIEAVAHNPPAERFVFLKSWNEWAEGNYLEPDTFYGYGYLEAIRDAVNGRGQ